MNDKNVCTQLTADEHEEIDCQLLQLKGVVGLILTVTKPDGDYANNQINSSAWLVADVIENIRSKLEKLSKPVGWE
ncbi:hypothetical protein [Gilliamella sp. Pas-s27]|uniref:hypothetical protein n=1 Tax=Gilliamella sp. Pas-s27 TaxID=2687311 RepID=UPI001365B243|nr:hypothetical protein [Gilliamella sp. Pas-s27]MWP47472.1 hypothetical protein [Gilliamella sp. Pas-s27]